MERPRTAQEAAQKHRPPSDYEDQSIVVVDPKDLPQGPEWQWVPGGTLRHNDCVKEVPSGTYVDGENGYEIYPDGTVVFNQDCPHPRYRLKLKDKHGKKGEADPVPPIAANATTYSPGG
jgi:hypothetical protein